MLVEVREFVCSVYTNVAADIIRRSATRRGATAKRATENAADFFTLFFGTIAYSLYLLLGGSFGGASRLQLAIVAMVLYVALNAANRRLIRRWVLDDDGVPRTDLGRAPWVRPTVYACLLGMLALWALGSIKYAFQ